MVDPSTAPAGWYLDGRDERRRYWDGSQWTELYEEVVVRPSTGPAPNPSFAADGQVDKPHGKRLFSRSKRVKPDKLATEARAAILNAEIAKWVQRGWVLEGTLFAQAILRRSKWRVFGLDLLLSIVTVGVWLIYVIYRSLVGETKELIVTVDRYGRVRTSIQTYRRGGE